MDQSSTSVSDQKKQSVQHKGFHTAKTQIGHSGGEGYVRRACPNSGKSYHHSTTKVTASLPQPSDGPILEIGSRLEGHLARLSAIQTHPSCRFYLGRRFPRPMPERVLVADHQSGSGFSGTSFSARHGHPMVAVLRCSKFVGTRTSVQGQNLPFKVEN